MSDLIVCCPRWPEARAIGSGLDQHATARRTGCRSRRAGDPAEMGDSHFAGPSVSAGDRAMVAVATTCSALAGDLRPGDLVVACEVAGPAGVIGLASAELLAADLRRSGLAVRVGRITTLTSPRNRAERARAAADGAIAADTQAAHLLAGAAGRSAVVLAAICDTRWPQLSLAATTSGRRALRSLRLAAPALARWAAAGGPRSVLLAGPRSFCAGVDRAIEIVERAVDSRAEQVYVRRQIVHNTHVVAGLERRGAAFVDDLAEVPDDATVVFSAHGVSPAVRAEAARRGLATIDATCPLVAKVHAEARRFAAEGYLVVLIGHGGHDEVEGIIGEAPGSIFLAQTADDVSRLQPPDPARVAYMVQTTLPVDEADVVVGTLLGRFPDAHGPRSNDICYATTNRQRALRAIAADSDVVLVAGSPNSSNSRSLVETATRAGTRAYLVDQIGDVRLDWLAGAATVGITAGASAPPAAVSQIVAALAGLGQVEVSERTITTESVRFGLPRQVQSL
jgi:4-hydroxy-3-methylbut-2-en-1-yl diphosphate reductase